MIVGLLTGYLAGKIAGTREVTFAGIAAAAESCSLAWGFMTGEYVVLPLWTRILLLVTTGPAMLAGAWIRMQARLALESAPAAPPASGTGDRRQGDAVRLAFQGEPGAYSEAAALVFGGSDVETLPCLSFDDVFEAVVKKKATHGVRAARELDWRDHPPQLRPLLEHDLMITGEVELDVVHCLQALPGTKLADVKIVYSHPQALAQCERYLRDLGVTVEAVYDTAGGAKLVTEQKLPGPRRSPPAARPMSSASRCCRKRCRTTSSTSPALPSSAARRRRTATRPPSSSRCPAPRARFQGAQRVRAARHQPEQARKPADPRPPWEYLFYVEVDARREDPCARGVDAPGRVREVDPRARDYKGAARRWAK